MDTNTQATAQQKVGTIVVPVNEMEEKYAFFVHGGTTTYIMRNGAKVLFRPGAVPGIPKPGFVTNIDGYVAELKEQIKLGHPDIHTESGYELVTEKMLDPLAAVKDQAIADFMKSDQFKNWLLQQKGVGTPENSESEQSTKFAGATSASISEGAASSDSANAGTPVVAAINASASANTPAPGAAPFTISSLPK